MKIEGGLFAGGAVFYIIVATIYGFMTHDMLGITVIGLTGGLALMVGSYVLHTGRRIGVRPEDRLDAEIDEADPNYGFFPPHSWWPLPVGLSVMIIFAGFIFATWLMAAGVVLLMYSVAGWLFEYETGPFASKD